MTANRPSFSETRTRIEAKITKIAIWAGIILLILAVNIIGYLMMTSASSSKEARDVGVILFSLGLLANAWLCWTILINALTWVSRRFGYD